MGVIFDTSALIAMERASLNIDKLVEGRESEPFGISVITVSELLHGVHRADSQKRRLKREAYVEKIIETFPIYPFDLATSRIYARIWANLAKRGINIGAHDLMIAATSICLGFSVITSDIRDYKKIRGLTVEKF
ncbi:MAG: type II toxin-antitoxin system VapC family toxin [Deferribacteres bacterium]|nr:type II toxin-antitoxin system VapC family toxin [Deferribacteres bacterium]